MKKRIAILIVIAVLVLASIAVTVIHAYAADTVVTEDQGENEAVESISESETDLSAAESEATSEGGGAYIDDEAVSELIAGTGSKVEAVVLIAGLFGISVEEAETMVDNFIAFGDQHFEDSDIWAAVRADASKHPEKWVMYALILLVLAAVAGVIIRCLIKNAMTQTNNKLKFKEINEHEEETCLKLDEIKILLGEIKEKEAELYKIERENEELKGLIQNVIALIEGESAAVDSLKANSETSLKVNEETALQIVQLLNIAMDRKVPIASAGARKLWYEDAITKIKEKAGMTEVGAKSE